jgi:hypothetical protein
MQQEITRDKWHEAGVEQLMRGVFRYDEADEDETSLFAILWNENEVFEVVNLDTHNEFTARDDAEITAFTIVASNAEGCWHWHSDVIDGVAELELEPRPARIKFSKTKWAQGERITFGCAEEALAAFRDDVEDEDGEPETITIDEVQRYFGLRDVRWNVVYDTEAEQRAPLMFNAEANKPTKGVPVVLYFKDGKPIRPGGEPYAYPPVVGFWTGEHWRPYYTGTSLQGGVVELWRFASESDLRDQRDEIARREEMLSTLSWWKPARFMGTFSNSFLAPTVKTD